MSELYDFNQRVIREFRANQGKVSGQLANMPVLLLTMTGARTGRTLTTPLVYTTDGEAVYLHPAATYRRSICYSLSRVKSSGGAAHCLSGAGLIACKDVGRFAAFSCPWSPSTAFYKL